MSRLRKVVKTKVLELTKTKNCMLQEEFDNYQAYLRGDDTVGLYSATKQGAQAMLRQINRRGRVKPRKRYPLYLRNDVIKVVERDTKLTRWWIRIPVHHIRGGVWCPIKVSPKHEEVLKGSKIKDSQLIWKGDYWGIHLVVERDAPEIYAYSSILAIDLGEVRPAVAVLMAGDELIRTHLSPKIRGVRMHYAWLRQRLGKKKAFRTIKKVGRHERRTVDSVLHKESKDLVELAEENKAAIVLGDLKGIRNGANNKGKRFRSKVDKMPYYRLTKFIEYKAAWKGVPVFKINERGTSHTCHRCGGEGRRVSQGLFKCSCGLEYNADLNGAINIAKRFSEQDLENRAGLDTAPNLEAVMPGA